MERRFMSVSLKSKLRFSLLKLRSGGMLSDGRPGDWEERWKKRLERKTATHYSDFFPCTAGTGLIYSGRDSQYKCKCVRVQTIYKMQAGQIWSERVERAIWPGQTEMGMKTMCTCVGARVCRLFPRELTNHEWIFGGCVLFVCICDHCVRVHALALQLPAPNLSINGLNPNMYLRVCSCVQADECAACGFLACWTLLRRLPYACCYASIHSVQCTFCTCVHTNSCADTPNLDSRSKGQHDVIYLIY